MKRINLNKLIILIFFCFISAGCTIIALEIYSNVFERVESDGSINFWINGYPREELYFYSGKNRLQGFIYGGENNKGLVVIVHGIKSYADENYRMIMFLVKNGWRVFAYNATGVDGSEGHSMLGLSQGVIDLESALAFIKNKNELKNLPVMLLGYSWGGYSVCAILNFYNRVNAVISLSGFNSIKDITEKQSVDAAGGIYYVFSPQIIAIEKQLFGNLTKLTAVDGINKSLIPVMIITCSADNVVPANTISIYAYRKNISNPNAEYIYLDGDDAFGHFLRNYPKEELYIRINNFLEKFR